MRHAAPKANESTARTLYVLDTNVLLHDPAAIFHFKEHDIGLPTPVLEELDNHKKGISDLARNARQITRLLNDILAAAPAGHNMDAGFDLSKASNNAATGKLHFLTPDNGGKGVSTEKADNLILMAVRTAREAQKNAILVTKDINLRVKALSQDVPAEDYRTDRVLLDSDVLPTGYLAVDSDEFWIRNTPAPSAGDQFFRRSSAAYARITDQLPINSFVLETSGKKSGRIWRVESRDNNGHTLMYSLKKEGGQNEFIEPRSREQAMALDLLHDPNIDVVSLLGMAGSGKTLLALAAGLAQVKAGHFQQVLITRATVPMGEDIGFLPGSEEEKMGAWLGGTLQDCYSALGDKLDEKLKAKVEVPSMSFMRGRSFQDKFIIIDEAQNLTIKQMRGLLTRAGNGTKVVVTGNLGQIDSPYLDAGSSGLAWAVKTLQNWEHGGHLILPRGERSRLATFIEEASEGLPTES